MMKKINKLNSYLIKFSLVAALALFGASNIFAFDYGAVISNNTSVKTAADEKNYFNQKNDISIWARTPLGKDINNYFIVEGLYKFEYDAYLQKTKNYLDLSLFKFVFFKEFENGQLDASVGRFFTADTSGIAFAQNSDGAFVKYSGSFFNASVFASYTGLQNANVTSMIPSLDSKIVDAYKVYELAEKYFVTMATVSFPSIFLNQSVSAQWVGGFRTENNPVTKNFISLNISGPIIKSLLYDVTGMISFNSYNNQEQNTSPLVKARVGYYFPNASVGANFVFAGEKFVAITSSSPLKSLQEPEYTDIMKLGLFGTYKPLSNLLLAGNFDFAWGDNNYEFKAVQYGLSADFQIKNDVLVGASWNQYFDINKSDIDYNELSIRAKISL